MVRPELRPKVAYRATVSRAVFGLGAAAVCAGLVFGVALTLATLNMVAMTHLPRPAIPWWAWPRRAFFCTLEMLPVVALAAPIWWAFDRKGVRQWWAAPLVGALTCGPGAVLFMLFTLYAAKDSPPPADFTLEVLSWAAATGAAMGLIAWRIAYRREPKAADAAEAF
ncbi:MAG: hypothetical protein JSR45_17855 [Proteobacteria bacterium]|nr:hypothetical protein [Pseudomonadota bacterium]